MEFGKQTHFRVRKSPLITNMLQALRCYAGQKRFKHSDYGPNLLSLCLNRLEIDPEIQ